MRVVVWLHRFNLVMWSKVWECLGPCKGEAHGGYCLTLDFCDMWKSCSTAFCFLSGSGSHYLSLLFLMVVSKQHITLVYFKRGTCDGSSTLRDRQLSLLTFLSDYCLVTWKETEHEMLSVVQSVQPGFFFAANFCYQGANLCGGYCSWLWGCLGAATAQSLRRALCLELLPWKKVKIQNLKYSFYWVCLSLWCKLEKTWAMIS